MEFALVNDLRTKPIKGLKGFCPICGNPVIAKCGNRKVHHWAHVHEFNCDPWWENETPWHREWKSHFPDAWHENVFFDQTTGEKHIADIFTPNGITLEFQNSPMSYTELGLREAFYKKMIWVVNGHGFVNNIKLVELVPNFIKFKNDDFVFRQGEVSVAVWRKSDNPDYLTRNMVWIRSLDEFPEIQMHTDNSKSYGFTWKNKREIWYSSNVPVFIDVGNNILYWIRKRQQFGQPFDYITLVSKSHFISKYLK